jgi:F0F1-type ATP synthase delta subunit
VKRRRAAAPYAKALFELATERAEAALIGRELDGRIDRIRRRLAND